MGVSIVSQYQLKDGGRDEFLDAARETFKLFESLGGRPSLRQVIAGGELTGIHNISVAFPNQVARGAYIDAVTQPENAAKNSLVTLVRAGGVTLVSRIFLNETPATEAMSTISQVLATGRFRISPGRLAEAEGALTEAKSLRQALGAESHTYTVANGGANTGVRTLGTHAASHRELAELMDQIVARNEGGLGPIPRAIDAGALIPVGTGVSTLVAL